MEDHHNHVITEAAPKSNYLRWFGVCLAAGAAVLIAITVFKVPLSTVGTGALFLACPLLHSFMMRGGKHEH